MLSIALKKLRFVSIFSFLIFSAACAPKGSVITNSSPDQADLGHGNIGGTGTTPLPTAPNTSMKPLAWESTVKNSNLWSSYIYSVISLEEPQMLADGAATDVTLFCPKYNQLDTNQRLNFWGQLFAGMTKFESGWKPTSYYVETTMGIDPITGRQVASEGLLQLSYQDGPNYGIDACNFDWNTDKAYSNSDSRKSIFDPFKNLRCGVKIMAKLLKKKQAISFSSGVYWAVLRQGGAYTQVPGIAQITKSLSFCVQ